MSKFKVGDKVKHATLGVFANGKWNDVLTVRLVTTNGFVGFEETDTWLYEDDLELVQQYPKPAHIHRDIIIEWANGADIQFKSNMSDGWVDCFPRNPQWCVNSEYRIKPQKSQHDIEIDNIQNLVNELQTCLDNLKQGM